MTTEIDQILHQRGNQYGSFEGHAEITQALKQIMKDSPAWQRMTMDKKESLEMIMHKIGRILNGNPDYKDSWTDIIGYAKLVQEKLED